MTPAGVQCNSQHPAEKKQNPLQSDGLASFVIERLQLSKRRAGDSNPQPVARHLNSNQVSNPENAGEYADSDPSAARGAAVGAGNGADRATASTGKTGQETAPHLADDPELTEVIDRWATLPEAVRLAVLALVRKAN